MTAPHPETGSGSSAPDPRGDRELMTAHASGDERAFAVLVARYRQRFWNLALRTLGDREEAADALQDAFVRAYRAAGDFRSESEVTTWLHRIVLNVCLSRIARRRAATAELDETSDVAPATDEYGRAEARLDVQALLGALPDEQRLPIVLVDIEGYSVAEAARALEVAEGTVKSRCARGRARMAAALLARRDSRQAVADQRGPGERGGER